MLVIGDDRDSERLRSALAGRAASGFDVDDARDLAAAAPGLRARSYGVIVIRVSGDGEASRTVRQVRELGGDVAVVALTDGDCDGVPEADAALSMADAPAVMLRCVRMGLELARARAELAAAESRFRGIIQATADGIVIVGQDQCVRFVNHAAERLFGRSADQLVGGDFGVAVVTGERTEMDIVRGDRTALVAELRVGTTSWEGERCQIISLRDITDRKRAEERRERLLLERAARQQAERSAERSSLIAEVGARLDASMVPQETLPGLAALMAERLGDWCVIDLVDGRALRRTAAAHADSALQPVFDDLAERAAPGAATPGLAVLESGRSELHRSVNDRQLRALVADEDHLRLWQRLGLRSFLAVPLVARDEVLGMLRIGRGQRELDAEDLALAQDVAARVAQKLEHARLYEDAVAANRARSDFLALVSHELRTPLNGILGYTHLLLSGMAAGREEELRYLRRIDASAMQLLEVIQEILVFAGLEASRLEPELEDVRLGALVGNIETVVAPLARERGLEFRAQVDDPELELHTDAGKLRRIILDLLSNAVKFTERGRVGVHARRDGDAVAIDVNDTGRGIAADDRSRIFEPFWQAEETLTRHLGGTGLGLTVARRLARLLGGDITLDSEPGTGSRFTVRVPIRHS